MARIEHLSDSVTLYLGDCREILPALGKVDAVVTDPPYGINFPYYGYADTEDNLRDLITAFVPACRAISERVIITPGVSNICLYPRPQWTAVWTWETTATYGALGYNQWQPILVYGADQKGFGSVNGILKSDRIHFTGGSAKIAFADGEGHTCPKPLEFVKRLIARFCAAECSVLDPFMGSGTTGVAAVNSGRKFIGIEVEPKYFDISCRRITDALANPDLFIAAPTPRIKQQALAI